MIWCVHRWVWVCVMSYTPHLWRQRSRNLRILRAAWFCFLVRRLLWTMIPVYRWITFLMQSKLHHTCVCIWSTWGSACRSGSIAGWGLLLCDSAGTSFVHGNSGNDSGSGWLLKSSSYKVHTAKEGKRPSSSTSILTHIHTFLPVTTTNLMCFIWNFCQAPIRTCNYLVSLLACVCLIHQI